MDWEVCVLTKSNQVKTVIVRDFIYMSDASEAALALTNGKQVIWCNGHNPPPPWQIDEEVPQQQEQYTYAPFPDIRINWDYDKIEHLIAGYLLVAFFPTIILMFIHPIAAIVFNVVFGRWWFTK
jgi:hypothetical protein